jgi:hypothetical protein
MARAVAPARALSFVNKLSGMDLSLRHGNHARSGSSAAAYASPPSDGQFEAHGLPDASQGTPAQPSADAINCEATRLVPSAKDKRPTGCTSGNHNLNGGRRSIRQRQALAPGARAVAPANGRREAIEAAIRQPLRPARSGRLRIQVPESPSGRAARARPFRPREWCSGTRN